MTVIRFTPRNTGDNHAAYTATVMAYDYDAENNYPFFAPRDLIDRPVDEVVEAFFRYMNEQQGGGPLQYELNGAVRHDGVVTAMGSLMLNAGRYPFVVMISKRR